MKKIQLLMILLLAGVFACGGSSDDTSIDFRLGTTSVGGTVLQASASNARQPIGGVIVRIGERLDTTDTEGKFLIELGAEEIEQDFVVIELTGPVEGVVSYPNNGEGTATTVEIVEELNGTLSLFLESVEDIPDEPEPIPDDACIRLENGFYRGDDGCGIRSTNLTVTSLSSIAMTPFGSNGTTVFIDQNNGRATASSLIIRQTGDVNCTIICGPPRTFSLNCGTRSGVICAEIFSR